MAELIKLSSRNDGLLMGTPGNDRLKGSAGHPQVDNGRQGVIKLLAGNDVITSRSDITLRGVVTLNEGDDVIQSGESTTLLGAYEGRSGNARICLGAGNDRMESEGEITSSAADLSAGKGDDQINGQAGFHQSYGTSAMGSGADSIIAGGSGLEAIDTYLRTGSGCDVIDVITGGAYLWFATVRMGADDDHLRVRGSLVVGAGAEINLGGVATITLKQPSWAKSGRVAATSGSAMETTAIGGLLASTATASSTAVPMTHLAYGVARVQTP